MEKKIRMEVAVESGGFVGNGRNGLRARPDIPDITERAARSSGRAGYSGRGRGNYAQIEKD